MRAIAYVAADYDVAFPLTRGRPVVKKIVKDSVVKHPAFCSQMTVGWFDEVGIVVMFLKVNEREVVS